MRATRVVAGLLLAVHLACDQPKDATSGGTQRARAPAPPATCVLDRGTRQVLGQLAGYADAPRGGEDQYGLIRPGTTEVEWIPIGQAETVGCDRVWTLTHEAVGQCAHDRAGRLLGVVRRVTGRPSPRELEVLVETVSGSRDSAGAYAAVVLPRQATVGACAAPKAGAR